MSAIAAAHYISTPDAPTLVDAATSGDPRVFDATLQDLSSREMSFEWSGHVLDWLLPILEGAYGIALTGAEPASGQLSRTIGLFWMVLTHEHRDRWLAALTPSGFDAESLERQFDEAHGEAGSGAGEALLGGVTFLYKVLQGLQPGEWALVAIR
jgi:hypothetical protein